MQPTFDADPGNEISRGSLCIESELHTTVPRFQSRAQSCNELRDQCSLTSLQCVEVKAHIIMQVL